MPLPFIDPLVELLLSPRGLGGTPPPFSSIVPALESRRPRGGLVRELSAAGDPRDPAVIRAVFASPGRPRTRPTIVFLHGKGGSAAQWLRDAADALDLGLNVLLPSLRGHEPSTGTRISYGVLEKNDLANLIGAAHEEFGIDPSACGIDACSMGTLIALQFAAEHETRALWLQSPFGRLFEMATHYMARATGLPPGALFLPARVAIWRAECLTGLGLSDIDPVEAARKVTCPAMIVHGENDDRVPADFAAPVFSALAGPKEIWRVPRCGHCHHASEPRAIRRAEYRKRWRSFWRGTLLSQESPRAIRAERPRRQT